MTEGKVEEEEERGQVIGQNPKAEVARFSSEEIGRKNSVFRAAAGVTIMR